MDPTSSKSIVEQVDTLPDKGLVEEIPDNESPQFISPALQVDKKDLKPGEKRSRRTLVGFQKLNPMLKPQAAQIPMFEKQIEKAARYKYKCTADFRSGFWQQGLTDRAKALTAFITPSQRILRWKVLRFEITVAPGAFQEATNHFVYLVSKDPTVRKLLDEDKCCWR